MDSSNSGSFQSSSGGAGGGAGGGGDNDEYDSTTQSISSFFSPSNNFNPNLNHLLQPPPPTSSSYHNHQRPPPTDNTFYTPTSTQPFSPNTNPTQDPGSAWAGTIRPDQNLAAFGNYPINHNSNSQHGSEHHRHQIGVKIKNPKKRTRASRRAPTTVLTTDTTNFRQMVQEFTGIPTGPFTSASFSRRLDLFSRGSDGATGSLHTLRPSAQKTQPQPAPFLNSGANIVESGTSNNNTTAITSGNYHFGPSNINDFQKQPSTFLDLQNPMFSFQSLLQNTLPQQSNDLSGLQSSSKRWRDENGKLEGFEGVIGNTLNIGGSKLNSGIENSVVSSRNGGDQVQGNEGSWICPSN